MADERLLPIREASRFLNVHPNTLRRWGDKGLLPVYRIGPARHRRFRGQYLTRFLAGARTEGARTRGG